MLGMVLSCTAQCHIHVGAFEGILLALFLRMTQVRKLPELYRWRMKLRSSRTIIIQLAVLSGIRPGKGNCADNEACPSGACNREGLG